MIDSQKGAYSKNGHIYVPVLLLCEELGIKYESDINGLFFADISSDINWNDKTAFQTLSELLRDVVYEAPPSPEAVIEQLKAKNQMEWVGRMNNIRSRATEIVNSELIYA